MNCVEACAGPGKVGCILPLSIYFCHSSARAHALVYGHARRQHPSSAQHLGGIHSLHIMDQLARGADQDVHSSTVALVRKDGVVWRLGLSWQLTPKTGFN